MNFPSDFDIQELYMTGKLAETTLTLYMPESAADPRHSFFAADLERRAEKRDLLVVAKSFRCGQNTSILRRECSVCFQCKIRFVPYTWTRFYKHGAYEYTVFSADHGYAAHLNLGFSPKDAVARLPDLGQYRKIGTKLQKFYMLDCWRLRQNL